MAAAGKSSATGDFSGGYWCSFRSHTITQPYCPAAGGLPGHSLGCPAGQRQHGPAGSPLATVCAAIAFLIPLYVELVAGSAETVGELPRYFLGYSGRGVVGEGRISQRLGTWMRQRGRLLLFLLAFLPNPVFRPGRCDRRGPEIAAGAFLGGGACRKDTEVGRLCLCLRL